MPGGEALMHRRRSKEKASAQKHWLVKEAFCLFVLAHFTDGCKMKAREGESLFAAKASALLSRRVGHYAGKKF